MSDAPAQMQCMEVWGGSQLTTRGVEMGGLDAWVYSKPYEQADAGGDVYYASSCATGRISRLLLADVSGHGNAVADTAVELRRLMRRFVNFLDQTEFVRSMNRQFVSMSQQGRFATAVVTTFFATTGRMSICNAGHPRPLLYRAATGQWSILELRRDSPAPNNIPLGILDVTEYEQFDLELQAGDLVLCYTDALIESRQPDGQFIGEEGLLLIAEKLPTNDPSQLTPALLAAIAALHEGNLDGDDVTVLVLRASGKRPRYSFVQRLWAQLRMMGAVIRSINPRAERAPLPDLRLANVGGAIIPRLGRRWRAPTSPTAPRSPR
jgi:sigma-B regulation protein RsbU (phosphoserine phosphatase)